MLDKTSLVTGPAAGHPESILERCERANPGGDLDEDPPYDRRKMRPSHFRPPQHQKSPQPNEEDESQVETDERVGEDVENHRIEDTVNFARSPVGFG